MACSHSTVSAYLSGRRLPRPQQLESFVLACGDNAAGWLQRLEAVRESLDGLPATTVTRPGFDGLRNDEVPDRTQAIAHHPGRTAAPAIEGAADPAVPHPSVIRAGERQHANDAGGASVTDQSPDRADDVTEEPTRGLQPRTSTVSAAGLRIFGAEFVKILQMRLRTVEETAAELGVPPSDVARWAAGLDLPPEAEARSLDEYLTAGGAIQNLVAGLRSRLGRPSSWLSLPSSSTPSLLRTFQNVAEALRRCLVIHADRPTGWRYDLRELSGNATPVATAYGLRSMLLLEDALAADLIPVVENLKMMAYPAGGYASREQSKPRPDATAAILNTLRRIVPTDDFSAHVARMENDLGDFERNRPFILTTMLETCLLLRPGSSLVETLADSLLAARRPYGDLLLWPEKAEPLLIAPAPSVAHTARAVRALATMQAVRPSSMVQDALEEALSWLIEQRDLHNEDY